MEHLIPPILGSLLALVKVLHGLLLDRLSKMLFQIVIVDDSTNALAIIVVGARGSAESKLGVLDQLLGHEWLLGGDILGLRGLLDEVVGILPLAHHVEVVDVGEVQVILQPGPLGVSILVLAILLTMIEGVELAPLLLAELAEVAEGDVALLANVEVLKNGVNLVDLIFDP